MTLAELYQILKQSGLPVTYSHFEEGQAPDLPYICYMELSSDNFKADGIVFKKVIDVDIELYSRKKELSIEWTIESLFEENGIVWDSIEEYIDDEKVFKKTYEVRLL